MMHARAVLLALGLLTATLLAPARAEAGPIAWNKAVEEAEAYADQRSGIVSFAVSDEEGRLRGRRAGRPVPSASVLKVILMGAYLDRPSVARRPLRTSDRRLLGPMIRRSDNDSATYIRNLLGASVIYRYARGAGLRRFRLRYPWGLSEITAREMAPFMRRFDRRLPWRHRRYARRLLATVVPSQRWGIASVGLPSGWRLFFKSGWGSGTGRVCHQVALLERGSRRVSVAITIEHSPNHGYGTQTLRGISRRLLRALS